MSEKRKPTPRQKQLFILIPVVLILLPIVYSIVAAPLTARVDAAVPFLEPASTESETCVDGKTADEMRYHHMDLLKRMRDRVLREGDRSGTQFDDCKGCHKSRERFCNRCHDRVNLTPDCFGCHDYP